MSDGFDGIHIGCFPGWNVSEDDADESINGERYIDGSCRDAGWHTHERYDKVADKSS